MNKITLNIDTKECHSPQVIIQENGKTLIDMPGDSFIELLKVWTRMHDAAHKAFNGD